MIATDTQGPSRPPGFPCASTRPIKSPCGLRQLARSRSPSRSTASDAFLRGDDAGAYSDGTDHEHEPPTSAASCRLAMAFLRDGIRSGHLFGGVPPLIF